MSDCLTAKYTLTDDDVVHANRANLRISGSKLWPLAMVLISFLAAIYAVQGNWVGVFQALVIVAVIGVAKPLFTRGVKWIARKSPHIGVEHELTASSDGLTWKTPHGNTELQWSAYTSVREAAAYFLFYSGVALCSVIPKRAFADPQDVERFRELIRAQVPKTKLLDRRET